MPKITNSAKDFDPNNPTSLAMPDFRGMFEPPTVVTERNEKGQIVKSRAGRRGNAEMASLAVAPHIEEAVKVLVELLHCENGRVRLGAATELLNRWAGRPVTPIEADTKSLSITLDSRARGSLDQMLVQNIAGVPLVGTASGIQAQIEALEKELAQKKAQLLDNAVIDAAAVVIEADEAQTTELLDAETE